jgi:hypothetical protein
LTCCVGALFRTGARTQQEGRKPINPKCENVATLPTFCDAYRLRRCILPMGAPASSFVFHARHGTEHRTISMGRMHPIRLVSLLPKCLNRSGANSVWRHRVLNVAPEVRLQRGRVLSRIREGEPAGMSEHVGMDLWRLAQGDPQLRPAPGCSSRRAKTFQRKRPPSSRRPYRLGGIASNFGSAAHLLSEVVSANGTIVKQTRVARCDAHHTMSLSVT